MSYFLESESESCKELLAELANICLEQLMLSSDAYVCMIKMNMQGYKRLHRYLSKKFQCLYLDLQNEYLEKYKETAPTNIEFNEYHPETLKEHLESWNEILNIKIKRVGEIIREIFEKEGYICCIAQEMQKIFYKNIIKNERALKKFEDCGWDYKTIYNHDKYIHEKMKLID